MKKIKLILNKKYIQYLYTLRYTKLISYISAKWLQNKLQKELNEKTIEIPDIFNKIEFIKILFEKLKSILDTNPKNKYLYYYGFQIFYGAINKGLLLLIAGLIFGILSQILVATLAFISIRSFLGGLHFDSYIKCAWVSLASLLTIGLLAKYIPYNSLINLFVFMTLFCIALKYAPVEHKNRKLNNKQKIRFKYISLIVLCALYSVQIFINDNNINNCIMYGVLLSGIIALPVFRNIK